jgi:hypothetical protein
MKCEECKQVLARAGVTVSDEGVQLMHVEMYMSGQEEPVTCRPKTQVTGVDSVHSPE